MNMAETRDLGAIDGPMLIFGGPYGNLQATQALLGAAAALGIPATHILCTGDVAAYCADPEATVELVREANIAVVMGNCEESLGADAGSCDCGFEKGSSCDILAAQWYAYSVAALGSEAKAWMGRLPRRIAFEMAGRRLLAVHGSVGRINRFVFPATPEAEKAAELDRADLPSPKRPALRPAAHSLRATGRTTSGGGSSGFAQAGADGVIGGHCGLPFTQILGDRLWHNAGAIGLPANDGTPRVWYSLLRPADGGIVIERRALDYDHAAAARRMREKGLAPPYAEALETGLWPSDDFMPDADRQLRGQPLSPASVFWRHEHRSSTQPTASPPDHRRPPSTMSRAVRRREPVS